MFFYLNVEGSILKFNLKLNNLISVFYLTFFLFIFFIRIADYSFYSYNLNWLFFNFYFDDWYESLNNSFMNDFISLFLSYYRINSVEFIVMGYLLLLASIICVNMNKQIKNSKIESNSLFLKNFNFFNDLLNFSFLRKQNLNDQSNYDSNIRIFKKKKW